MTTNLEEQPVTTVELDLNRRVGTIGNTRDVCCREVDGEAVRSLALDLEERHGLGEVGKVLRVVERGDENANYQGDTL